MRNRKQCGVFSDMIYILYRYSRSLHMLSHEQYFPVDILHVMYDTYLLFAICLYIVCLYLDLTALFVLLRIWKCENYIHKHL
jgi:hypothetical protein